MAIPVSKPWALVLFRLTILVGAMGWVVLRLGAAEAWWSPAVETALRSAGTNRVELQRAVERVPPAQRPGLAFLLEHMPDADRNQLSADFLLENTELAYAALASAPWRERLTPELFLNDVLPYVCVNEAREAWRSKVRAISLPLVAGCRTPTEAARRLNEKLFPFVKVKYSTQRRRADQGPLETMDSGIATCTGLSILLIDACRSVGVPARLVGTPLWANLRGNHTWLEIWDGDWHFLGAAEPDPAGLDHGWFVHDASEARRDEPKHAIYASSFRRTGLAFPMVWAKDVDWVPAVNVTDRYVPKANLTMATAGSGNGKGRLLVKVLDRPAGRRVSATVHVVDTDNPAAKWTGISRDESADLNDILPFEVQRGGTYKVEAEGHGRVRRTEVTVGTNAHDLVVLDLPALRSITVRPYPARGDR